MTLVLPQAAHKPLAQHLHRDINPKLPFLDPSWPLWQCRSTIAFASSSKLATGSLDNVSPRSEISQVLAKDAAWSCHQIFPHVRHEGSPSEMVERSVQVSALLPKPLLAFLIWRRCLKRGASARQDRVYLTVGRSSSGEVPSRPSFDLLGCPREEPKRAPYGPCASGRYFPYD